MRISGNEGLVLIGIIVGWIFGNILSLVLLDMEWEYIVEFNCLIVLASVLSLWFSRLNVPSPFVIAVTQLLDRDDHD